jgi:predicted ferric reductase
LTDIDHTYWYLTRSSGFVAYLMLFVAVTLGLTMTGDVLDRWLRRYRIYDIHRFLSLMTLIVIVFHALIVLPDWYFSFSVAQLLLPFASPYRPLYMTLGLASLYLTAFIVATFYLRRIFSYVIWRFVHYATFGAYVLALFHGVGAGTDTPATWVRYLYVVTALIVFNLLVYRALKGSARGLPAAAQTRH